MTILIVRGDQKAEEAATYSSHPFNELVMWAPTSSPSVCVISQGKIPGNSLPRLEIEPGPRGGQTVRYMHSSTELS